MDNRPRTRTSRSNGQTDIRRQASAERRSASSRDPRAQRPQRAAAPNRGGNRPPRAAAPAPRGNQGGNQDSNNGRSPFFIIGCVVLAILLIAIIVGISQAVGCSSQNASTSTSTSTSASASIDAPVVAGNETVADGYRDNSQAKATANGNIAVARVRTEEERMAHSDSDNSVTPVPKTVYLTFDDGPSTNTHNILKVLDEYGVKATWFIKANQPQLEYVKDIWAAGHQMAIHTYSHDYEAIYASTSAFWDDLTTAGNAINEYLGFTPVLTRFPGGSNNSYNAAVNDELKSGLASQGYHYFDWNISSGDGADHDAQFIFDYIIDQADGCHSCCLLMHDSAAKDTTVEALPRVIEWFIDQGFEFDVLLADSYGYRF